MGDSIPRVGIVIQERELVTAVLRGREKVSQSSRLPDRDRALGRWASRRAESGSSPNREAVGS